MNVPAPCVFYSHGISLIVDAFFTAAWYLILIGRTVGVFLQDKEHTVLCRSKQGVSFLH